MKLVVHGLDEWIAQLEAAQRDIVPECKKVTGKAMSNIKKGAQRRVSGYSHLPHLPRSFSYTVYASGDKVIGEGGADRARPQGGLDDYIEYGTVNNPPIPHWAPAVDDEEPNWIRYLEQAAVKALEG